MSSEPTKEQKRLIKAGELLIIRVDDGTYHFGFWRVQNDKYTEVLISNNKVINLIKGFENEEIVSKELMHKMRDMNTLHGGCTRG